MLSRPFTVLRSHRAKSLRSCMRFVLIYYYMPLPGKMVHNVPNIGFTIIPIGLSHPWVIDPRHPLAHKRSRSAQQLAELAEGTISMVSSLWSMLSRKICRTPHIWIECYDPLEFRPFGVLISLAETSFQWCRLGEVVIKLIERFGAKPRVNGLVEGENWNRFPPHLSWKNRWFPLKIFLTKSIHWLVPSHPFLASSKSGRSFSSWGV